MEEEITPDVIRSPTEVALRALALYPVMSLAFGADRKAILGWLKEAKLTAGLSPLETAFIQAPKPTKAQVMNATWWSERLTVLLWALGKIEQLPAANEQCRTSVFEDILPPFAKVSAPTFIEQATLRPDHELLEMQEEILGLHWQTRDAKLNNRPQPATLNSEILQERHHAINWVIGYDGGVPWDEVTADT